MTGHLIAELGTLTGAELYTLLDKMARARVTASTAITVRALNGELIGSESLLIVELAEVFNDVAMQVARVNVPFAQAQATIMRASFRNHRPVRVPGTT